MKSPPHPAAPRNAATGPEAAPRKPRGRPRSFDRDAALELAMQVFWRKGYESTSIHDLTDAMGINPPSLYAAFGDKEKLYMEAVEKYLDCRKEAASCAFSEEPTARAGIERLLRNAALELSRPNSPKGCMLALSAVNCDSESVQHALAAQRAAAKRRLRDRIERGIREGDVPRGTDAAALADFFSAVFAGMSMQARDGAGRKSLLATAENAMLAFPAVVKKKSMAAA